ncbi:MAG: VWA domain-containing protein [Parachlamydiales bacterium]|jgi:hypothetical protein
MIYWENAYWAVLLLLLPLIWTMRWRLSTYRSQVLEHLPITVRPRSPVIYLLKTVLLSIVWLGLTVALMGPMGNPRAIDESRDEPVKGLRQTPQDVVFLIDASASMATHDGRGKNTRLDEAKGLTELIIEQLQGQNVALYAFTSELTPLAPATPDYLFTILTLRALKINEGDSSGTQLSAALTALSNEYKEDSKDKKHSLVILTDGGDNSSNLQKISEELMKLRKMDWEIFFVGVGSLKGDTVPNVTYKGQPVNSKLEEEWLKKIAAERGQYYSANRMNALNLSKVIGGQILSSNKRTGQQEIDSKPQQYIYDRYFQWPLTAALFALLFYFVLPDVDVRKEEQ